MRQSHYMKWRFYFSLNLAHSAHEAVRPEARPKVQPKLGPKFGPGWSQYLSLPSDANSAGFSSIATEDEQLREKQITFCVIIYRNRKLANVHAKTDNLNCKCRKLSFLIKHKNPMRILWESDENGTRIWWESDENPMRIWWESDENRRRIGRESE